MDSLVEVTSHENSLTTERREMNGSFLNQMFKLDSLCKPETRNITLLTEHLNPLETLNNDVSSKLLLSAHEETDYRLEKIGIANRNMNQQFFDCTSGEIIPVPNEMLAGIPEHASLSHLTESSTLSDSPISPLSMQGRDGELSLPWENIQHFSTLQGHMAPQNSIYQYTGFEPQTLMSRRASLPDNNIGHFAQFPDMSTGRKRVVSWADIETNSGIKNSNQNPQNASRNSHTRRFSLHLPIQSANPCSSGNMHPVDYELNDTFQKSPVNLEANGRNPANLNQMNFPIVYEPLPKPEPHPQTNDSARSKRKALKPTEINDNIHDQRGFTDSNAVFQGLEVYSDSNNEEEKKGKKGQQKHQVVVERRLSRRRERNRLAARRSREKRNQFLRELEQVNQALNSENGALKASLCEAIQELQMLRATKAANNTSKLEVTE